MKKKRKYLKINQLSNKCRQKQLFPRKEKSFIVQIANAYYLNKEFNAHVSTIFVKIVFIEKLKIKTSSNLNAHCVTTEILY